jgi:hypothetical protein
MGNEMILFISIIFSLIIAALSIKRGLYIGWVMLVNVVLSIYLSIFLTPSISHCSKAVGEAQYGYALCMTIVAVAVFLILHTLTVTFFTGIFKISFPKALNTVGAAVLGFVCGLLIWSFGCFVFLLTPIPHSSIAQAFIDPAKLVRTSVPPLRFTCGLVNLCSFQKQVNTSKVLDSLLYVEKEKPSRDYTPIEEEFPSEINETETYYGEELP